MILNSTSKTFTLFIPTLNEEHGLATVMPLVDKSLFVQILISDGNSQDDTVKLAQKAGYDVHIQSQKGIRHAYMEAWPKIKGTHVITFSPDGNCRTEDLPLLIAKISEGHDMVVASRYLPPAHSDDDDLVTAFGNWLFTRTVNFLHGGNYTDAMGIYRGYRKSLFSELGLDRDESYTTPEFLFSTKIGCEPLLSVRAARAKLRVCEIASDEPARSGGVRKLQVIRWGLAYFFQFFSNLGWKPSDKADV